MNFDGWTTIAYLVIDVLPQTTLFVDISQPSAGQISAGFTIRRLLNLGSDRTEHRTKATLAAGQRKNALDRRILVQRSLEVLDLSTVRVKQDGIQWNVLEEYNRLKFILLPEYFNSRISPRGWVVHMGRHGNGH